MKQKQDPQPSTVSPQLQALIDSRFPWCSHCGAHHPFIDLDFVHPFAEEEDHDNTPSPVDRELRDRTFG
jgi:hypothetical protein